MPSEIGDRIEVEVGAPGHGGFCVARHDGRAVFVRHALPGERVVAELTELRPSYWRADAVTVLRASPDRVPAPCPHAGPGRCGGCDWQHARPQAQRALKAEVVREQFARLAGLDVGELLSGVEALPGGSLGWRNRVSFAVGPDGSLGLRRHRSTAVEPVAACPLGVAGVGDSPVLRRNWTGLSGVEVARGDDGASAVLAHRPARGRHPRGRRPPDQVELIDGPAQLCHRVGAREFRVSAGGFWQVHPAAATSFAGAAVAAAQPRPGDAVLDLYAGAGLLTGALADAVGPSGRVLGVESDDRAVTDARANLADLAWVAVRSGRVGPRLLAELGEERHWDLVVLDPPRSGAGPETMRALLDLGPRAVCYVACDPAALARDVAIARARGWVLGELRAFDAFPMTHHVECVALLRAP